jgi:hypothetical protein
MEKKFTAGVMKCAMRNYLQDGGKAVEKAKRHEEEELESLEERNSKPHTLDLVYHLDFFLFIRSVRQAIEVLVEAKKKVA